MKNPLTSLAKRLARRWPSSVLVRRRGARFLLHPQNWIDNRIFVGAPFENEQLRNARAEIKRRKIDLVVDVGANIGVYTVLLGRLPQVETVLAFEPVRRNFMQLMGNIFVNGLSDKVDARSVALGSQAGRGTIYIDPRSTGLSRLDLNSGQRSPSVFSNEATIEIAAFDGLYDLTGRKAFVKIDVEGNAVKVLSGMRNFLSNNDVVVQVELLDTERDNVTRLLSEMGFKKIRQIEADAVFVRP